METIAPTQRSIERRLATVLVADMVGYSAHMGTSEEKTVHALDKLSSVLERHVSEKGGRVFARAGDGFLSEFPSPVSAVRAGFEIQRELRALGRGVDPLPIMRIGVHLADVIVDGENLLGDGVNIASRVESVAEPGSVYLTQTVFEQVKRTVQLTFENLGAYDLKNISEPVVLYRVADELGTHSFITGGLEVTCVKPIRNKHHEDYSIAVLPFTNMSSDSDQEYFADGFSEDLITELSRFRDLFVLSRNASFGFKNRNVDSRQIGRDFGVRYCLEGSVRKMGGRVRLTAQLIDAKTGDHAWADKYDFSFEDVFDVQDKLASSIVGVVAGRMTRRAEENARRKRPHDMAAYDCLLRGMEYHRLGGVTRESAEGALRWFDSAIARDPTFGRAYAWRACALATLSEWSGETDWTDVIESGRRGIELDNEEAESHRIIGSLSLHERDYDKARYHFARALELNPNHAYIVGRIGELYNFVGEPEKALEYQARARELDPFLPEYCRELEVIAYYLLERYAETVDVVKQFSRVTRRAAAYAAAAASHLDDSEVMHNAVARLLMIDPDFTITNFLGMEFYREAAVDDRLKSDLHKAGLEK